ncbi:MAG TPA: hypothetical protein VKB39_03890 [Candidatus Baltobacteraceae bacterium]|nr:hypothetical protein [Candidatus Baltobacteraceae bacterium]
MRDLTPSRWLMLLALSAIAACSARTSPLGVLPHVVRLSTVERSAAGYSGDLFVANVGKNTQRGSIAVFAPGGSHPVRQIVDGIDRPSAIAFDLSGDLIVANSARDSLTVYRATNLALENTITQGVSSPSALATDFMGNVYAGNQNSVTVYAPRQRTPIRTISGVVAPRRMAFDQFGSLYVVQNSAIAVYAPGTTKPFRTIRTGLNDPRWTVFASDGSLVVANAGGNGGKGSIAIFPPYANVPKQRITSGIDVPARVAFDSSGNMYVANDGGRTGSVAVFAKGGGRPFQTIKAGINHPVALDFAFGRLYVANAPANGSGSLSAYAKGSSLPTQTITMGVNAPSTMRALGKAVSSYLFVSNAGKNSVTMYPIGTGNLVRTISSQISKVTTMFVDGWGNLDLLGAAGVSVYAPGGLTPLTGLSGTKGPTAIALDSNGTLYVSNAGGGTKNYRGFIGIYPPGSTKPARTIAGSSTSGIHIPVALTVDAAGKLYVGNLAEGFRSTSDYPGNYVTVFAPGGSTPSYLIEVNAPERLILDGSGNLFVGSAKSYFTSYGPATIVEYPSGSVTASRQIALKAPTYAFALDGTGNLYVADESTNAVDVYAPGATKPSRSIVRGVGAPSALLFDPAGNLYVANASLNTVTMYAPGSSSPALTIRTGVNAPNALALGGS